MKPIDLPIPAVLEEFEPRILYSADAAALAGLGTAWPSSLQQAQLTQPASMLQAHRELVVLDLSLPDAQTLLAGLQAERDAGRPLDIVTLDAGTDGIAAVTQALEGRTDIAAMHWLSHGADGRVQLGAVNLDAQTLAARAGEIAAWGTALGADADLLIYGCDVAGSSQGTALMQALAGLTGVDVAASDDPTGAAARGGDWTLEARVGAVQTALAVDAATQQAWQGLMPAVGTDIVVNVVDDKAQTTIADARGSQNAVAHDSAGRFVVVWTSDGQDTNGKGIFARLFAADGTPLTGDVQVNQYFSGQQQFARVAMDDAGRFVVTWTSDNQDSSNRGVYARRFDTDGTALGSEFLVNVTTAGVQTNSVIAMNATTGDFAIAWQGSGVADTSGVFMRRFAADGTALDGSELRPSGTDQGSEVNPAIAMDRQGRVVLVWEVNNDIFFQRFDAAGLVQGGRVQADGASADAEGPAVTVDGSGNFTIAYRDRGSSPGVYVRGFTAQGANQRALFQVAADGATSPSLDATAGGGFVVTWQTPTTTFDVMARAFPATGAPGSAFQANSFTSGAQQYASVAARTEDYFVVVWSGKNAAGKDGVAARLYAASATPPTITSNGAGSSAILSVAENTANVTTVTATDPNLPPDTLSFSVSGVDAALFSIDPGTGVLQFVNPPNYEAPRDLSQNNIYEVDVSVTDGTGSDSQHLYIMLTNVDDAPKAVDDYVVTTSGSVSAFPLTNDTATGSGTLSLLDFAADDAHGSVTANYYDPYRIDYSALLGFVGTDQISYLLTDGQQDMQHYWRLGGDGYDAVTGATDVVFGGAANVIRGKYGNALLLDGNNDGVRASDIDYGSAGFSVGLWFQIDPTWPNGLRTLYGHGDIAAANSVNIGVDGATQRLQVLVRDGNDTAASPTPLSADISGFAAGTWHHVMVTVTPTGNLLPGTTLWVDNNYIGRNGLGSDGVNPVGNLVLGADSAESVPSNFSGALDTVSIWGHALSSAQRQAVYDGGDALGVLHITVDASATAAPTAVADSFNLNEDSTFDSQVTPPWFHSAWQWRQSVTLDNSAGPLLTQAPVLVTLDASNVDYSHFKAGGADLRFVDPDGTLLTYEIENWDPAGTSRVWVKVPQIDANSTTDHVWLYAGNAAAADAQDADALWGANAAAVLHLGSTLADASGTSTGITQTGTAVAAGRIGEARSFDGLSSDLRVSAPVGSLQDNLFDGGGTFSAWFRADGWGEGGYGRIASTASDTFPVSTLPGTGWALEMDMPNQRLLFEHGFSNGIARWRTLNPVSLGTWYQVTVVYDSSQAQPAKIYLNGQPVSVTEDSAKPSGATAGSDSAQDLHIGNDATTTSRTFQGVIDEVRATAAPLSDAEIAAAYRFSQIANASVQPATAQPGVMGNDSDPAGLPLTAVLVSGPAHAASFTFNGDGTFVYQPEADLSGPDGFRYMVTKGVTASDVVSVSLQVLASADAPVITSYAAAAVAADSTPENRIAAVTLTATDVDTPTVDLVWSVIGGADAALFTIDPRSGALAFVSAPDHEAPGDAGANNVYDVSVAVSDGTQTDTLDLALTVTDTVEISAAVDDAVAGVQTQPVTITPLDNDINPDAPALWLLDARQPLNGRLTMSGNQIVYTPGDYFTGLDQFDYRLADGSEGLSHYWRLDGDGTDLVGGLNGNVSNSAGTVTGRWGDAMVFDGNSRVDVPDFAWAPSRSISIWFQRNGNAGYQSREMFSHMDDALSTGLSIGFVEASAVTPDGATNVLRTVIIDDSHVADLDGLDVSATGLDDGGWHLYTLTMSAGVGSQVYIDGVLAASSGNSGNGLAPGRWAAIGGPTGGPMGSNYVGVLDGVGIYDRALAVDEVTALFLGGPAEGQVSVNVAPLPPAPPVIDGGDAVDLSVAENSVTVTTISATDSNGPTPAPTYSIIGGADAGLFSIDASTGDLRFVSARDFEAPQADADPQIYHVVVEASDGGLTDSQTVNVTVTDVDEFDVGTPVDVDPEPDQVLENAPAGMPVGLAIAATDADGSNSTVTYSLTDDAGGRFTIDSGTGFVKVIGAIDRETAASLSVTVQASSTDGSVASHTFTLTVLDQDEFDVSVPVDVDSAPASVNEHAAVGSVVGLDVDAFDADATTNLVTWSLDDSAGGRFAIDPNTGVVTLAARIDEEGVTSRSVTVRATSQDGSSQTTSFAIAIQLSNDSPPVIVSDGGWIWGYIAMPENQSLVTTVVATDADRPAPALSYTLAGGADDALFTLDAVTGELRFTLPPDYENPMAANGGSTYDVEVRVSDGTWTDTQSLTVAVSDVDEFDVGPATDTDVRADAVREDASIGQAVGVTAHAVDADATFNLVTYSLSDDAGGRFAIGPFSGVLMLARRIVDEGFAAHTVTVTARSFDGSTSATNFTVAVIPISARAPVIVSDGGGPTASLSIAENGAAVTTVVAHDADVPADTLVYRIAGGADAGAFTIDAGSGALGFLQPPDFEAPQADADPRTYHVTVEVSDGLHVASQAIAVTVTDVDEFAIGPLTDADPTQNRLFEDALPGQASGLVAQASDADGTYNAVSYALLDDAGGRFAIDAVTGVVSLTRRIDDEAIAVHTLLVQAQSQDGTSTTAAFDITITPVNAWAPVIDSGGGATAVGISLPENTADVTTIHATDADRPAETLRYAIVGGADAARFGIDPVTGALRFLAAPDFEMPQADADPQVYHVTVAASDGTFTDEQAWAVTVQDIDEFDIGPVSDALAAPDAVLETAAPGAGVGVSARAVDADGSASPARYSLLDDASGRFAIDAQSGDVTLARAIANEALPSHRITVQARSGDGSVSEASFDIAIGFVNKAAPQPVTTAGSATGQALTVPENTVAVTTVKGSDADLPAATLRYAIVGGADAARFVIDADTGVLRFAQAPDHEAPTDVGGDNRYELVWAVSDGELQATQAITVTVTNVDEPPMVLANALSVNYGVTRLDVQAQDPDTPTAALVYQVSGESGGWFVLSSAPNSRIASFTQAQVDAGTVVFRLDGTGRDPGYVLALSDGTTSLPPGAALVKLVGSIPIDGLSGAASTLAADNPPPQEAAPARPSADASAELNVAEVLGRAPTAAGHLRDDALLLDREVAAAWQRSTEIAPAVNVRLSAVAAFASRATAGGLDAPVAAAWTEARATPAARFDVAPWRPVVSIDLADTSAGRQLAQVLDRMGEEVRGDHAETVVAIGSTALVSGGLSVGYVLWLLRGGVLVATVMSSVPAWAGIDPLPVLSQARRQDEDDGEQDADPIERLFGRARRLMSRPAAVTPPVSAPSGAPSVTHSEVGA